LPTAALIWSERASNTDATVLVQRELDKRLSRLTSDLAFGKRFFKA
jgi:hypothetical protein